MIDKVLCKIKNNLIITNLAYGDNRTIQSKKINH